ncbi:MAG: ISNCY family transposase, partial [Treponema sp.]|nr:ISNCY family transposase [Treponema sp.]
MIRNEDGQEKQDCERNAAKRWLANHGQRYAWLKPTLLGDDLYSDYNTCTAVVDGGYSFIFMCKEESHPWLTETVKNSYPEEYKRREWNGRNHLEYRYQWINGVEIRDSKETLLVNYL